MIKSVQNEAVRSFWLTSRDVLPGDKLGVDRSPAMTAVRLGHSRSNSECHQSAGPARLRALYDAVFRQAEATPNIVAEIDSASMIKVALRAGIGATIHPRSSWMEG